MAFVFVDISVHIGNSGLLLAVAAALVVLAVTAQGPLGIFRVCPPRLHLILVVVVAAMAAVAPVIPALRPDIEGIIVLEFGAVGLIRVATLTDATRPDRAAAVRRRPDTAVIDVTATAAGKFERGARAAPALTRRDHGWTGIGRRIRSGGTLGRSDRRRGGDVGTTGGGPAPPRGRGTGQADPP